MEHDVLDTQPCSSMQPLHLSANHQSTAAGIGRSRQATQRYLKNMFSNASDLQEHGVEAG